LLSLLASSQGCSAGRGTIRSVLWGDFEQAKANANLRQLIARIRRIEREISVTLLRIAGDAIALDLTQCDVDLVSILAADRPTDGGEVTAASLIALWRGHLLEGFDFNETPVDEWISSMRDTVKDAFLGRAHDVLELTSDRGLDTNHWTLALRMLDIDNAQELPYRVLMKIYARQGDKALAFRTFEKCKRVLRSELGVEPSRVTIDLANSLRQTAAAADIASWLTLPPTGPSNGHGKLAPEPQGERREPLPRLILLPPNSVIADNLLRQLATGLIEDITVGLTRYRSFSIFAPHTGTALAARGFSLEDALKALDVEYAVTTSIIPRSGNPAITFRLTNASTAEVLWATESVFRLEGLNEIFGEVVRLVVRSLVDSIERAELRLPAKAPSSSAYRLVLEGRGLLRSSDLRKIRRARTWFKEAATKSDRYASAYVGWSRSISLEWLVRGMTDRSLLTDATKLADRAIDLDPLDGRALREKGLSSLYLREFDSSISSFEEARRLNPHDADTLADYSDALAHAGDPETALAVCREAILLNPLPPDDYLWVLASIYYQLRQYEKAFQVLKPTENSPATARLLAACAAKAGDIASARRFSRVVRSVYPDFRVDDIKAIVPNKYSTDTDHLIEGLRLAGLS
jgi:DNA-binding SARP family transcriptional activator/TolB-like protein